jgi:NAD(P)H-dependent FMN reductase
MKILAISGSLRVSSSNTAILRSIAKLTPSNIQISIDEVIDPLTKRSLISLLDNLVKSNDECN